MPLDTLLYAGTEGYGNFTYSNYQDTYSTITTDHMRRFAATCPLAFVSSGLRDADRIVYPYEVPWLISSHQQVKGSGIGKAWKQLVITVECRLSSLSDENAAEFVVTWRDESYETVRVRLTANESSALTDLRDGTRPDYRFLNLRTSKRWPISADILFGTTWEDSANYTLCVIFASWSEADTWMESSFNQLFSIKEWTTDGFRDTPRDLIHMDDKWMEGIASFSNKSFFSSIAEICESKDAFCFEFYLGLHITDAIAQAGNNRTWPEYFSDAEQSDNAARDAILYKRSYYTYAYRFDSSRGIPFAFTFLLLHVLMVLAHLVEIIRSKDPWQGSNWDNFGDMLVLALASKPPDGTNDLTQQSSKSELWMKTATVGRELVVMAMKDVLKFL